ncbi:MULTISPECIES: iron-containing alcohol dehydrogenase family protein [unclassified Brenneria]|uniref:iron-containing alcohol dehydrogenase family protein n=1 Tax=unclassified Brenneria TaxID=2634434 RepID=UPI0029C1C7EE|nr:MULTISPECIES: iron-containing alcohol dehydrogenase family protein [unclassified Brenneria]MDX5628971.1 iron-containing alcohol dehydrogenase family protein [Brenneria sp. L3-3Z]MDX5696110.1 iron-containing alcohol dehydrogenase family protein [Brenneria sp. L4-2C]MEE3661041.1 iron-containing alcohol dehydrogenase family protein [Brenneria sp. g21c3]
MQAQNIIFPAQILRGPGVISQLGDICALLGKRALVIGGHQSLAAVNDKIRRQLEDSAVELAGSAWFGGESSEENIRRLAQAVKDQKADMVISVGGGKSLDTGKAVGVETNVPVVTIPTIAATCAAVTPLTIRYHDDGRFRDLFPLPQAPAAVIIDSEIIAAAPLRWLAAGLGDTLAKWYEFRAISDHLGQQSGVARSSCANSRICYDLIGSYGASACDAVRAGKPGAELDQVLDAIFMFAGLTSLMSSGAHAAASHAIYEGFTVCDKTRAFGHGLLVGFGNLCLLALENRSDEELREAIKLAHACAVPLRLREIAQLNSEELDSIVQASLHAPDMANMPGVVTAAALYQAIARVEALADSI